MSEVLEAIGGSVGLMITCTGLLSLIIIGLIYYLKKRLEHKQIMAAIEKGAPLSELRRPKPAGPKWIKNLAVGIALLILAVSLIILGWDGFELWRSNAGLTRIPSEVILPVTPFVVGLIFLALGVALIIRASLQKKTDRTALALEKGMSLTDLEHNKGIASIAVGIGCLILSGFGLFAFLYNLISNNDTDARALLWFIVLSAIGTPFLIHGLLSRKAQLRALAIEKGIPLSQLQRHPNWMTSFVLAIALLVLAIPYVLIFFKPLIMGGLLNNEWAIKYAIFWVAGLVTLIVGLVMLIRSAKKTRAVGLALVGFFFVSLPFLFELLRYSVRNFTLPYHRAMLLITLPAGICLLIRALLLRKAQQRSHSNKD